MSTEPNRQAQQALQVIKHDDMNAELHVTTSDEAASLLWAAQWLDEHREYSVTALDLRYPTYEGDDDPPGDATVVVTLHMYSEPQPARLGPWPHGVPPLPL